MAQPSYEASACALRYALLRHGGSFDVCENDRRVSVIRDSEMIPRQGDLAVKMYA